MLVLNMALYTVYCPVVVLWLPAERPGEGGAGGKDRLGWGHIRILYKALENYTKPQQTIQRYEIL